MADRMIELGLARPGEAAALARMSRDFIENGLGWTYRTPRMSTLIADPAATALVAREPGRPVGSRSCALATSARISSSSRLIPRADGWELRGGCSHWLVESASAAGIASIHVELRAGNKAAHGLYESAGFAETFRVPGYYQGTEAAVRMIRVLRAPGVAAPAWLPPKVR